MPSLQFNDLKVSVGAFGGDFHVQIRTLDIKLTKEQIAEAMYPVFDAQEKALVASQTTNKT
jgi:DNA-directed RNA polymerase subunit E'/Rpb7